MTEIQSDRLVLRQIREDDFACLVAEIGDWEVAKWLARVPHPYTTRDAQSWLNTQSSEFSELNIFKDKILIGGVGLTPSKCDNRFELGYWLGQSHWGQGYATEAAQGLLAHARDQWQVSKIKASFMKGNHASAKVLEKLGFRTVGQGELFCLARNETVPCTLLELDLD